MKAFDPQWIAFRNFVKTGIQFAVCTKTTPWFLWPLNNIWTECPSHTAVDNSFLHVFVGITVQMPLCLKANHVWVLLLGPAPFFLVVLLLWRRNASLAGGFAGRLVVWWWFCFCDLICLFFGTGQLCLCTFSLTAYVSFRTVPQCDYGQSRGKKKYLNWMPNDLGWLKP